MGQTNFIGGSLTVIPNSDSLKDLRSIKGQTQRQVEEATGIPSPRLSLYESGHPISLAHIRLLAKHYGATASTLTLPDSAKCIRSIRDEISELYGPSRELQA